MAMAFSFFLGKKRGLHFKDGCDLVEKYFIICSFKKNVLAVAFVVPSLKRRTLYVLLPHTHLCIYFDCEIMCLQIIY